MSAPFVWFDLTVPEDAKVAGFYQGLFGWQAGPGAGDYQDWLIDGGQPWAGTAPAGALPAGRWVPYVVVGDLDAAVTKAVDLGATVVRDKVTGPAGTAAPAAGVVPAGRTCLGRRRG